MERRKQLFSADVMARRLRNKYAKDDAQLSNDTPPQSGHASSAPQIQLPGQSSSGASTSAISSASFAPFLQQQNPSYDSNFQSLPLEGRPTATLPQTGEKLPARYSQNYLDTSGSMRAAIFANLAPRPSPIQPTGTGIQGAQHSTPPTRAARPLNDFASPGEVFESQKEITNKVTTQVTLTDLNTRSGAISTDTSRKALAKDQVFNSSNLVASLACNDALKGIDANYHELSVLYENTLKQPNGVSGVLPSSGSTIPIAVLNSSDASTPIKVASIHAGSTALPSCETRTQVVESSQEGSSIAKSISAYKILSNQANGPLTAARARINGARTYSDVIAALEKEIYNQDKIIGEYAKECNVQEARIGSLKTKLQELENLSSVAYRKTSFNGVDFSADKAQTRTPIELVRELTTLKIELEKEREAFKTKEAELTTTLRDMHIELEVAIDDSKRLRGFVDDMAELLFAQPTNDLTTLTDEIRSLVNTRTAYQKLQGRTDALPSSDADNDAFLLNRLREATDDITSLRAMLTEKDAQIEDFRKRLALGDLGSAGSASDARPSAIQRELQRRDEQIRNLSTELYNIRTELMQKVTARTVPSGDAPQGTFDAGDVQNLREKVEQYEKQHAADRAKLRSLEQEHIKRTAEQEEQNEHAILSLKDTYEKRIFELTNKLRAAGARAEDAERTRAEYGIEVSDLKRRLDDTQAILSRRMQMAETGGDSTMAREATERAYALQQTIDEERRKHSEEMLEKARQIAEYEAELGAVMEELQGVLS